MVRSQFHSFCSDAGAIIAKTCTRTTTHLVTTDCEADNPTKKVLEAMKRGTLVVSEDFVHACIAAGRAVGPAPFTLIGGSSPSSSSSSYAASSSSLAQPRAAAAGAANRSMISDARGAGNVVTLSKNAASSAAASAVMLAEKYEPRRCSDPTGWWMSEKLDGMLKLKSADFQISVEVIKITATANRTPSCLYQPRRQGVLGWVEFLLAKRQPVSRSRLV